MAVVMTPIYTQTVGAGGAASITFNNIPQYYTDLKIVMSARSTYATDNWTQVFLNVNNAATNSYSKRSLFGYGTTVGADYNVNTSATTMYAAWIDGAAATASTFGNAELYIPNYTSSNYKQVISDCSTESNGTATALNILTAGLILLNNSITSITLSTQVGNFAQYSTFSLYGIIRYGA